MKPGTTVGIAIVVLIVIVLVLAYWRASSIAGTYVVLGPDGATPTSQMMTVAQKVSPTGQTVHTIVLPDGKTYRFGSFTGLGFDLYDASKAVTVPMVADGHAGLSIVSGNLTITVGANTVQLARPPVVVTSKNSGTVPEGAKSKTNDDSTGDSTGGSSGSTSSTGGSTGGSAGSSGSTGPTYLGCFKDTDPRALPQRLSDTTFAGCRDEAKSKGMHFFGLQCPECTTDPNTAQCWGGYATAKYDRHGSTTGCGPYKNMTEQIGRANKNSVYKL